MNGSVFRALVRKDLYLMRPLIIATLVAGAVAFVLMRFGRIGFAVGGILFLTTNVAGGINQRGVDYFNNPQSRTWLVSLSLNR